MIKTRMIALLATGAVLLSAPALAQVRPEEPRRSPVPTLRVNGMAEVSAEPDMATFDVGVEIRDPSASKAMAQAAQVSDRLIAALRALGIPRESIQTTQLYLRDEQEPIPQPRPAEANEPLRFRRVYVAQHLLRVEVGKDRFTKIGDYLDAAMKAGANQVQSISFGIRDDSALRREGLSQAVKDARTKADVMAAAAGVRITGLLLLNEGGIPGPFPVYETRMDMAAMRAPAPVPPSQIRRNYSVVVDYAIVQQ